MASASLYQYSGMNQRPMFINWTPYNLDLSPYRQNQQIMLSMAADLAKQRQATQAKAREMEIPDMKGLSSDVQVDEEDAMMGKQEMISAFSTGNINSAEVQKKAATAMRKYGTATAPSRNRLREQQQAIVEGYGKRLTETETKDGQSLYFMDSTGMPTRDPDDPDQFLMASKALQYRKIKKEYSIYNKGAEWDFEGAIVSSPVDYEKRLYEGYRSSGRNEGTPTWKQDFNTLHRIANETETSPAERIVAGITLNQRAGGNSEQVMAGITSELAAAGPAERAAMFSRYADSADYQKHARLKVKDGGFLADDGSGILASKVYERMLIEPTEQSILPGIVDEKGKARKVSFAANFVMMPAARALSESNIIDPNLVRYQAGGKGGSGSDGAGKYNYVGIRREFGPVQQMNHATNQLQIAGRQFERDVAVVLPDGTVKASRVPAVEDEMDPRYYAEFQKKLGMQTTSGVEKPLAERPELAEAFPTAVATLPQGTEIPTKDLGGKVLKVEKKIVYLPAATGPDGKRLDGQGGSIMDPYYSVWVALPEGKLPTDYVKSAPGLNKEQGLSIGDAAGIGAMQMFNPIAGLAAWSQTKTPSGQLVSSGAPNSELQQVRVDDDEYMRMNPDDVRFSDGDNMDELGSDYQKDYLFEVGQRPVSMRVLVKATPAHMNSSEPEYMYDPRMEERGYEKVRGAQQQAIDAEQGYQMVLPQFIQP